MATAAGRSGRRRMITDIHRVVRLPHPRAKVWRALTQPDLVDRWLMKPEGYAAVVGTKFVLRAKGRQRGWRGFVECEVLAVEEGRLLRWSWLGDEAGPTLVVTFRLEDEGGGTRLSLDHEGFEGFGGWLLARLMMGPGWGKLLGKRLAALLDGRD